MAIALTGLKAGAIARLKRGFASVSDENDRTPDDVDELVLVRMPMALTRPSSRAQLQEIDSELGEASGQPETTPGLVLAGLVERLRITRSGARSRARDINLHLPILRSPVARLFRWLDGTTATSRGWQMGHDRNALAARGG